MGRLLGYPQCCVDRYAEDRSGGVNVETRAAGQLAEAAVTALLANGITPAPVIFYGFVAAPAGVRIPLAW